MTSDQKLSPEKEEKSSSLPSSFTAAGGDIDIFPDIAFFHLDKTGVKAYKAVGKNKIYENLICFACDKNLTSRHSSETKFTKLNNPHLLTLVTTEVVKWGSEGEKFCLFYQAPIGKPLLDINNPSPCLGWDPDDVMAQIVNPILSTLSDMRDKDIVHGEIWPGNLYFQDEKASKHILLGDCLSLPQSYNLPSLYEPVERAFADSIGRGAGTLADDLYSFGVSLAVILRTSDPMQGATEEEITKRKIEKGTYSTLIGKDRFNGATLELLRGLLYDDAEQRWTLDDILEWKDGRRLSPKQSTKRIKATRPIDFNHEKFTRPELLAQSLVKNPSEAVKIVEEGDLEIWIERAIEDKTIKIRIEQMIKDLKSVDRSSFYNDQLSALLASNLYQDCPVQYKNMSFHLSGFGKYITHLYSKKEDIQHCTDILKSGLLIQISRNMKLQPALSNLRGKFDACRTHLQKSLLGGGLERCLYVLNPECHCLSPSLENFYVRTPEQMMFAFESLCERNPNAVLFDRHTVAFLSLKDKKNIDAYLPDLRSSESYMRVLGQLRVLATIQKRSNMEAFPNIANWVSSNLNQVYERFHDAKQRDKFKNKVNKIKKNGDLTKIATLFDDTKLYQNDMTNFYQAMSYFRQLNKEKKKLEDVLKHKLIGHDKGHQISSLVSVLVSLIVILMMAYSRFIAG